MNRASRIILKTFAIIIASLAGLCILGCLAVGLVFNTGLQEKIAGRFLPEYVDADVNWSRMRISPFRAFPSVSLVLKDFSVTYPHDRFSLFEDVSDTLSPGRGALADTLLSGDRLLASVNLGDFFAMREIAVSSVELSNLHVFAHRYDTLKANWNVLMMPEKKDTTASSKPLRGVNLHKLVLDSGTLLTYEDVLEGVRAEAAFDELRLKARLRLVADSTDVRMTGKLSGFDLGRLVASAGPSLFPEYPVSTDAVLNLSVSASGGWNFEEGVLPQMRLNLDVPASRISYGDVFRDGSLTLEAVASLDKQGVVDLNLGNADIDVDGIRLNINGDVHDLTGVDPSVKLKARSDLSLSRLSGILPSDVGVSARGRLNLDVDAAASLSQLDAYHIFDADITAHASGDSLLADTRSARAYMDNPDISLTTHGTKGRARLDVMADRMGYSSSDSLLAGGSGIKLSLVASDRRDAEGKRLPDYDFACNASAAVFRNTSLHALVSDAAVTARAQLQPEKDTTFVPRWFQTAGRDTSKVRPGAFGGPQRQRMSLPDFLSEREFAKHDIDISIDRALSDYLWKWDPSGTLDIGGATIDLKAFPLSTRVESLKGKFTSDEVDIASIGLKTGSSQLSAAGKVSGLKRALTSKGFINLSLNASSRKLDIDEILTVLSTGKAPEEQDASDSLQSYSLVVVPANVIADVHLNARNVDVAGIHADTLKANAAMRRRCLQLTDVNAVTPMGRVLLDCFYSTPNKTNVTAGFDVRAEDVTAERVIEVVPQVDTLLPMLKSFKGLLNCQMAATAQLDTNMCLKVPTIDGVIKVSGKDLSLDHNGSLTKISRLLMLRDREVVHVKEMAVDGTVSSNQIEVFPFVFSLDRYTLALTGWQNIGSDFKYHVSVLNSPLPFKFGINVFGNSFDKVRFSLCRPQFKTTTMPLLSPDVDAHQLDLRAAIRDIFARGVDSTLKRHAEQTARLGTLGRQYSEGESDELLSVEEMKQIQDFELDMAVEEEAQAVAAELERELEKLL